MPKALTRAAAATIGKRTEFFSPTLPNQPSSADNRSNRNEDDCDDGCGDDCGDACSDDDCSDKDNGGDDCDDDGSDDDDLSVVIRAAFS